MSSNYCWRYYGGRWDFVRVWRDVTGTGYKLWSRCRWLGVVFEMPRPDPGQPSGTPPATPQACRSLSRPLWGFHRRSVEFSPKSRLIFVNSALPTSVDRASTLAVPSMASTTGSEEGVSSHVYKSWLYCDHCCRWLSPSDLRAAPTRCWPQGAGGESPLGCRKTSCASGEGATKTSRACTSSVQSEAARVWSLMP